MIHNGSDQPTEQPDDESADAPEQASAFSNEAESMPVVDYEAALDIYGGDEEFLKSILGTAVSEIQGLMPQLD